MQRRTIVAAAIAIAALVPAAGAAGGPAQPSWTLRGPYSPTVNPTSFVSSVDNRYFPLKPGTAFHFVGQRDGKPQTDDMVVTSLTKVVLGVKCVVVRDTVSEKGKPVERTFDWYAQDRRGNVWYMGEDSFELQKGRFVKASDSWQAGVKGAKPGIIMPGHPRVGDVYRQEYYPPGGALDQAKVLSIGRTLHTIEWSPVEPQLEEKDYVAGRGEISEKVVAGGNESFRLSSVTH